MDAYSLTMSNPMTAQRQGLRERIAAAFSGRGGLADNAGQGVRDYNAMRLGEESQKAAREAGFQMARTGQYGGSQDIENQKERARIEDDTLRQAEQNSLTASNTFRGNDANAQARLYGNVNAGLGSGDSITQALAGLDYQNQQQLDAIKGSALGSAINQFSNLSSSYQIGDARDRARRAAYGLGLGGGNLVVNPGSETGKVY